MQKAAFILFCIFFSLNSFAQTLGGEAAYTFLKLPSSPLLAAAGGVNVSYAAGEVGLSANNPALLQANLSHQVNASFNAFFAGIRAYSLTGSWYAAKWQTSFGGHVHYLDYGTLSNTDAAGNITGQFRPVDYVAQFSAAKNYLKKWTYGATLKFIQSAYGPYRSSALAADIGVHFHDSLFSASVLVKNMGVQLRTYSGETEELPFDLQVGFTKRLAKAPLGFSVTAQHLQTFNILYNDTAFNRDNAISTETSTFAKLVSHFVLATHLYAGPHLEATLGYNFLQRRELTLGTEGNGLSGFSAGLRLRFSKLQVLYARTAYQRGVAANQIGVTLHLDQLFGLGR